MFARALFPRMNKAGCFSETLGNGFPAPFVLGSLGLLTSQGLSWT